MKGMRDLAGDVSAMRALAHPVRLAVLELLETEGPLTATELARRLDELPGTLSWHLQILARHGFVHDAGNGVGRRRPWAVTAPGQRIGTEPQSEDEREAATELSNAVVDRAFGQLQTWLSTRMSAPAKWRKVSALHDSTLYLTVAEARELRAKIYALLDEHSDRNGDPNVRPKGAQPVKAFVAVHPLQPGNR